MAQDPQSSRSSQSSQGSSPLEDCINLLKGERDEQRLAGLLLATKFCSNSDHTSILKVYNAVGDTFFDRLLRTGLGRGVMSKSQDDNRDAYLQLCITILAAFCRVPGIASSKGMLSKIPLVVESMSKGLGPSLVGECLEFLFLVSAANDDGVRVLYESGGINILASQVSSYQDDSHIVELSMRLFQLIMSKFSIGVVANECPSELSMMVAGLAKQFALLHDALKFEALHLLSAILSSECAAPMRESLLSLGNDSWSTYVRVGVVAILQNRVDPGKKLDALILAESVMSIVGEGWLVGETNVPGVQDSIPADRCTLLVLESCRVEIAVLLNDLAYLNFEKSSDSETILLRQRNLAVALSLVEKIIKLISNVAGDESNSISETTCTKIISGLNETAGVVLEYLQDAKDHGQHKGDDLLASVRIIGSYLAETPFACKEKVWDLLPYMVSIQGEDEPRPSSSICFLLPMLCQITMEKDGCVVVVSSGVYKAVVDYLISLTELYGGKVEDDGSILLACDTILNLLLKEQIEVSLDSSTSIRLLKTLSRWAVDVGPSNIMMASSICALILDSTSESTLLHNPQFSRGDLIHLCKLISSSLSIAGQDMMSNDAKDETDLFEIILSGYSRWADRFPHIKAAVENETGLMNVDGDFSR